MAALAGKFNLSKGDSMKLGYAWTVLFSFALLLVACGNSNPLIGKWSGVKENDVFCAQNIEFTDQAVIVSSNGATQTHAVTYKQQGNFYIVTAADGAAWTITADANGLTMTAPTNCRFVHA